MGELVEKRAKNGFIFSLFSKSGFCNQPFWAMPFWAGELLVWATVRKVKKNE